MASSDDVKKLAALARISVPDDMPQFAHEFDSILAYVGQLDALSVEGAGGEGALPPRNVFREDSEPHPSGEWTEKLAAQFPERKGDALSVKQIISRD